MIVNIFDVFLPITFEYEKRKIRTSMHGEREKLFFKKTRVIIVYGKCHSIWKMS